MHALCENESEAVHDNRAVAVDVNAIETAGGADNAGSQNGRRRNQSPFLYREVLHRLPARAEIGGVHTWLDVCRVFDPRLLNRGQMGISKKAN